MKSFLALAVLLLSVETFAVKNPQFRLCTEKNGEFLSVDMNMDQVGLCKLGKSYVGSLDLVYLVQNVTTESLVQYAQRNTTCSGAEIDVVISENGAFKTLCEFDDGSLMDLETLKLGRDADRNQGLNSALGL